MRPKATFCWGWLLASLVFAAAPVGVIAQAGSDFVYVFPKFSAAPSAELVLSNLSSRLVTADISFYDSDGRPSIVFAEIAGGGQLRATSSDFAAHGARSFAGAVVVRASGPLSAQAKIPFANGFKTMGPSAGSGRLIIPFSQGSFGSSEISIHNDSENSVPVVLIALAANGSPIGLAQIPMAAHATWRGFLENAIPAVLNPTNPEGRDVSHVLIRVANNVFSSGRRIFALAAMKDFADPSEGIRNRTTDAAVVQAVSEPDSVGTATVPVFVHGNGYSTLVQVINTSELAGNVTLTAVAPNGSPIGGAATISLAAGGAIRRSVHNLFSLPSGFSTGSITIQSATPAVISAAIAASGGGFVVIPAVTEPSKNFAFAIDESNPEFFTGLTFLNPGDVPATVTIRDLLDDGRAVTRTSVGINARTSLTRVLGELLPEIQSAGFVHVSSDVPIVADALYGRSDNTVLAHLSMLQSQPDYNPPDPASFLVLGVVRHNGAALQGVNVQLSGPLHVSTVTDEFGSYVFQDVPAGAYSLRAISGAYTFSPSSIDLSINSESSRTNDFAATLVVPSITKVQPSAVVAGSSTTSLMVAASPLSATSQIVFEGRSLPTTWMMADFSTNVLAADGTTTVVHESVPVLKTTLDAGSIAVPRVGSLFVRTTGPGGSVTSASVPLPIGTPAPVLTGFGEIPQPLLAGNGGFTTTIVGSGFLAGVTIRVQDIPRQTILLTPTTVQVTIPAEDLASGGFLKVTAMNPAPTIGASNALDLAVLNPVPGILSISPNKAEVRLEPNVPALSLTVAGFAFKQGAKIHLGAFEIPTTFVSSTTLKGQIPQKAMEAGGAFPVTVVNPAPAVGVSESLPFLLMNLPPVLNSINAGMLFFDPLRPAESFTAPIIMQGSNFGPNSIFEINPPCIAAADTSETEPSSETSEEEESETPSALVAVSATLVNSHQAILTATIACAGVYEVRVRTPQPGGGISQPLSFVVSEYSQPETPVITSLSPSSVPAGSSAVTLTINGSNFQTGTVVSFGNAVLFPVLVTPVRIVVTIPSYLLARPDVMPVVVTSPSAGGSSNRLLFTVF